LYFIQSKLISQTKKYTGVDIGKQNEDELIMMMCGIYVQDSTFNGNVKESLKKINTLIITECLKQILPGVRAYVLYLRDASLPFSGGGENAFARPQDVSEKGTRVFTPSEVNYIFTVTEISDYIYLPFVSICLCSHRYVIWHTK